MTIRTMRPVVPALVLGLGLGALAARAAEPAAPAAEPGAPVATPVKWDQDRVTQYASELNTAIADLRQEIRQQPIQTPFAKRQAQHDLDEDMRLIDSSTSYLLEQLKSGAGREETEATFRRIDSLRLNAVEHAKRSLLSDPLMKDLVHAGELWNRMKPYYYGKR